MKIRRSFKSKLIAVAGTSMALAAIVVAGIWVYRGFSSHDTLAASAIWDGTTASSFAGGTGTQADPYQINTAEQLARLALVVNNNTVDAVNGGNFNAPIKYYILTQDIMLNDTTNWQNWATSAPTRTWAAIGNATNNFKANLDGGGYAIRGAYISGTGDRVGLFGYANGVIRNLGVERSYIRGATYVGGIVAQLTGAGALIENSYFAGTVNATTNNVGGIAGSVANSSVVTNCYNAGSVIGTNATYTGGIAGAVTVSATLTNSYNIGTVTGGTGITGNVFNGSTVVNVYHAGTATGNAINTSSSGSTVTNAYYLIGSAAGTGTGTIDTFDSSGVITSNNNGYNGQNLLDTLNSWVASPTVAAPAGTTYNNWTRTVFPVFALRINSISPTSGMTTGGTAVTISGLGFVRDWQWKQVESRYNHNCGIGPDDKVYCWGNNTNGGLGDNTTTDRRVPTAVVDANNVLYSGGKTVTSIAVGNNFTCALVSDGTVACWGIGSSGQLGDNTATQRNVPVAVVDYNNVLYSGGKTVLSISAGYYHVCALASDYRAYCWGMGSNGQIGDNTTNQRNAPVAVVDYNNVLYSGGKTIKQLMAGGVHTCAIATDNLMYCWGRNLNGQLGDGSTNNRNAPVAVVDANNVLYSGGKTIVSMASSNQYTCAVATDGRAYCWGLNSNYQLGDGTNTTRTNPVAVVDSNNVLWGGGKTVTQLTGGDIHVCATASDGRAYCWGDNAMGRLGDNTTTARPNPVAVVDANNVLWGAAGNTVLSVRGGYQHTCALASNYKAYCWGNNSYGQVGDNSITQRNAPVVVNDTSLAGYVSVTFGGVAGTSATLVDNATITVTTPPNPVGPVDVVVTTSFGSGTLINGFSYLQPLYEYTITASGGGFAATGLYDNATTYPVGTAGDTIQNIINAIRADAAGNDCEITFQGPSLGGGNYDYLDIGASTITFDNSGGTWGVITLRGKVVSASTSGRAVRVTGVTINNYADILQNGTTNSNGALLINGGGTFNMRGGSLTTSNSSPTTVSLDSSNGGGGTFNMYDGVVQAAGNCAVSSMSNSNGTINVYGGTINSVSNLAIGVASGTATIYGGTIDGGTGSAISAWETGAIVMGGSPNLAGTNHIFYWGNATFTVINDGGTNQFNPGGKIYTLRRNSPTDNMIGVINGASFISNFASTTSGYVLRVGTGADANNIILRQAVNVTFNVNGGTPAAPATQTVASGETIATKPTGSWTRSGYVSDGNWYTRTGSSPNFVYTKFSFGASGVGTPVTAATTLYLAWAPTATGLEYIVTANASSGYDVNIPVSDGTINVITGAATPQDAIMATRADAAGADCSITFRGPSLGGGNYDLLDIGTNSITFNNSGGTWGAITLKGRVTANASYVLTTTFGISLTTYADIISTGVSAIWLSSDRLATIAGGTIQGTTYGLYTDSVASILITGGLIKASGTSGSAVAIYDAQIAGAQIIITGGTIEGASGNAYQNVNNGGTLVLGGNPTINGTISTRAGKLSVITSGADTFAPSSNTYDLTITNPSDGAVAVVDGTGFLANFNLVSTPGYVLNIGTGANANDIVLNGIFVSVSLASSSGATIDHDNNPGTPEIPLVKFSVSPTGGVNAAYFNAGVATNNPTGYQLNLESNGSGLVCQTNSSLTIPSRGGSPVEAALSNASGAQWGWNYERLTGAVQPSVWRAVPFGTPFDFPLVNTPSGPFQNGAAADTYHIWYGAVTDFSQPICDYSQILVITLVGNL